MRGYNLWTLTLLWSWQAQRCQAELFQVPARSDGSSRAEPCKGEPRWARAKSFFRNPIPSRARGSVGKSGSHRRFSSSRFWRGRPSWPCLEMCGSRHCHWTELVWMSGRRDCLPQVHRYRKLTSATCGEYIICIKSKSNIPHICPFFYTSRFQGHKILHSKVLKFATKQCKSPQQCKITHKV